MAPAAIATLELAGAIVPKARPRFSKNGAAYLPGGYRDWKNQAIASLMQQWGDRGPITVPVAVAIALEGKHPRGSDSDNLGGAILDAMQGAGILRNDNLMAVPELFIKLWYSAAVPTVTIKIAPIDRDEITPAAVRSGAVRAAK